MASLFEHSELSPRPNDHRPLDFSHVSNNNEEILDLCVRRIKKEKDFSILMSQSAMECSSESSSPVMVSPVRNESVAPDTFQRMHMNTSPFQSQSSPPIMHLNTSPFQAQSSPPIVHLNTSPFQSPSPPIVSPQANTIQVPIIVTSVPNIPITAPAPMTVSHPPPTSLLQQQLQQPPNYINSFRPRQHHEESPINDVGLVVGIQSSSPYNPITQVLTGNNRSNKPTRPFKAYPKDPLSLAAGVSAAEALLGCTSNDAYVEFRRKMLDQIRLASNGANKTNKNGMLKRSLSPQQPTSTENEETSGKDAAYWERRRKNNEAAKRSRDARRAKEDEIAIRAAFLEQENLKLKYEVAALRSETTKLRCMLYNS